MASDRPIAVPFADQTTLPGLWREAEDAGAALLLAHGAGAGMAHRNMAAIAEGLGTRRIATLRFDFPFMASGSRRPDRPAVAQAAVRAGAAELGRLAPDLSRFAGGRSFGGRMTSQAQAEAALAGIRGLVFFAFPLHPAGKPSAERAVHLAAVGLPMLFLQGTRDALAEPDLLGPVIANLGDRATLVPAEGADHGFHVPARSGRRDAEVMSDLLDATAAWILARS